MTQHVETLVETVVATLRRQLKIGALLSHDNLAQLRQDGFYTLLNVSGADAHALYPPSLLCQFKLYQPTPFRDIFSSYRAISATPADYLTLSHDDERCAFLSAVYHLWGQLRRGMPIYTFCRNGEGRSPAVSMSALCLYWQLELFLAEKLVRTLRPQARITPLSHAAAQWVRLLPPPHVTGASDAFIRTFSRRLDRAVALY
jgi:hypothetical protein